MKTSRENGAKRQQKALPQTASPQPAKTSPETSERNSRRGDDGRPKTREQAPEIDEEQAP